MKRELHVTSKGIVIGGHYVPPAPRELGSEAEKIQTALLAKPKFNPLRKLKHAIALLRMEKKFPGTAPRGPAPF